MFKINKTIKTAVVALSAASTLMFSAPTVEAGHYLSAKQEKDIGNQAVADFQKKYRTHEDWKLTYVQDELMKYNPDKLWFYGTAGHNRGLERVLAADTDLINAFSYGGGQIFVYQGMIDLLASQKIEPFNWVDRPWSTTNLYEMSSLAAVVGHEIGHWEREDMLRKYDKQMTTRLIASLIPTGNIYAALGVAAGANLINAFNSRQMGFRTEQQADEKAMEYSAVVPHFSIGGQAIQRYRMLMLYRERNMEDSSGDWLNPHSKPSKRFDRALREIERQSKGFIKWNGLDPNIGGMDYKQTMLANSHLDYVPVERAFYVLGQIATAIDFDICKEENIVLRREDEVFPQGSPNNVLMLLQGKDKNGRFRAKVVDKYVNVSMQDAQRVAGRRLSNEEYMKIPADTELDNLAFTRNIIEHYSDVRYKYIMHPQNRPINDDGDDADD